MGCNCGSKPRPRPTGKMARQTFALERPGQPVERYGSRLEAEAAKARAGGLGRVVAQ